MSDARWRRVEELYHAGLGVSPERRAAFLEDECGGDSEVRLEVESLLVQHNSKDSVFDRPAWDRQARTDSRPDGQPAPRAEPLLAPGMVLGPYRIDGLLGEGGMGQVYRAHDSRLQRSVAIKVLFPGQDVRRFEQEARAVAALSHPNVVPIFDVGHESGVDYLVEELVEGESLRDILLRGPLAVARFRHLAVQIAEGLAAAHRAGIVHRDLKPANIMVSPADCARLLDFGLATRHRAGSDESSISSTHLGGVAGTAAYMSPEQVQGGAIDARSDIFSYGAVLYEMIAGRRAFARDTITATLAAVVEADPQPIEDVPHKLARIVHKCLSKDPGSRFQDIGDVRLAIEDLQKDAAPAGQRFVGSVESVRDEERPAPLPMPSRRTRTWAAAILFSAIALFTGWWWSTRVYSGRSETPLKVVPLTTGAGVERNPSFSPDGSQIVYEWAKEDGQRHLYIKVVGSGDPVPLTSGAAAEYGPAWSPDGRLIAFLRQLDPSTLGVFVMPPLGGVERKLTEVAPPPSPSILRQFHRRLDWTHDSRHLIVSAPKHTGGSEGLLLVSVDNGERAWLTEPSGGSTYGDRDPAVSPDGRMVAFARGELGSSEAIYLLPLSSDLRATGALRRLASAARSRSPAWTPDGKQIIYTDLSPGMTFGSSAWAIGLNTGDVPHPLLALGRNAAVPTVSRTGRLAYARQILEGNIWRQEIPARAGAILQPVRLTASSTVDVNAQYSPDGGRIAFASNRSGSREIWTCASDGARCVQVTTFNGSFVTGSPRWSPDGRLIVFDSAAAGQIDVYVVDANGGSPRRLTDATHGKLPSWANDGKWIYFSSRVTGRDEIWKIPSAGGSAVQVTRSGGFVAIESPDRRTLFYTKTDQNTKLWRSAADGSGETEVLDDVDSRGFAVAADRIYYLRQDPKGSYAIRRYVIATREDSQIASLAKPVFVGLGMSPDGKYLIYSQRREASNLMLVEDFH